MFLKSATYQTLTNFLHQYSGFVFRSYVDLQYGKPKKTIPTGTCIPFGKRMFVTVTGKILPCERIGQQFALGKVTADSGVELDLEAIADKYNTYYAKMENNVVNVTKQNLVYNVFSILITWILVLFAMDLLVNKLLKSIKQNK